MGNTNLPQFGAANTENSRDTRSGNDQLTDKQKKKSARQAQSQGGVEPAPGRPGNAPERVPGQLLDPADHDDAKEVVAPTGEDEHKKRDQHPDDDPYDPRNTTGAGDPEARGQGHQNSGNSAADAT